MPASGVHYTAEDFSMFVNRELPRQIDYFVLFTLGQFSYWERDYARALAALDRAIVAAEAGGSGEQPEGLAYAYFYRGNMHAIYRQDRPATIAHYARALGLLPDFANAAFNLGGSLRILANTCRANGDEGRAAETYRQAIEAYGRAIAADPSYVPAYEGRGLARYEIGLYDDAIADYSSALATARGPRPITSSAWSCVISSAWTRHWRISTGQSPGSPAQHATTSAGDTWPWRWEIWTTRAQTSELTCASRRRTTRNGGRGLRRGWPIMGCRAIEGPLSSRRRYAEHFPSAR